MSRPRPISGFPELLPGQRAVEQRVLDTLRRTFEVHGFASIETRALEPMLQLARKGEIDKEIYLVRRLQNVQAGRADSDDLGLHFDLTVPFARYVLEHAGQLTFPFRRYQVQKVWRGERPQDGRYREFTQADIDIVGENHLAAHHDVEIPLVMLEALERLHSEIGLPPVRMRVNNRNLSEGFYRGLAVADPAAVLQRVDKLDKIGAAAVVQSLTADCGLSLDAAQKVIDLASIRTEDDSFVDQVRALGVRHEQLDQGLDLLADVVRAAGRYLPGRLMADLSIARGLDYYTGTVYETALVGYESMGSISSGGRYDSLASDGRTTYPGVGISLGVSRMLVPLLTKGRLVASRAVPTAVLVAVTDEASREEAMAVATALRARGIPTEVAPSADRFGKQIKYADRRGIPYVWFGGPAGEVKDIRSGRQVPAEADRWLPPAADLSVSVEGHWD